MAKYFKSCSLHLGSEEFGVGVELLNEVLLLVQHFVGLEGGPYNAGCDGIGEKIGSSLVSEHINHLFRGGNKSSRCPTHCFTKSGRNEVYFTLQSEQLRSSSPRLSNEASSMAFVNVDIGVVLLSQFVYFVQRCNVAIHAEHTVRHHNPHTGRLMDLQLLLKVSHIQMFKP